MGTLPADEAERLRAVRRRHLLDTGPEPAFDGIVRLAASLFDADAAAIGLLDAERCWFKSRIGLDLTETPREGSLGARTAEAPDGVLVIPDMAADPRVAGDPVVTDGPGLRFYAGAAIRGPDGHAVGALWVAARTPRPPLRPAEAARLAELAALVSHQVAASCAGEVHEVTGLPNRRRLLADLRRLRRDEAAGPSHLVVVDALGPADLERLARATGHAGADLLILAAAGRVRDALRTAPLYHLDGCCFATLLQARDEAQLARRLDRLSARLAATARAAIGAAPLDGRDGDLDAEALHAAAAASRAAAASGRAWSLHQSGHDAAARRAFHVLSALGGAPDLAGQLSLAWQPRIDLQTGTCRSAEALLRWRHPGLGSIRPDEFIPLAEQSALMPRLTDLVLDAALGQLRGWRDAGHDLTISVNVSARDLDDDRLAARVARALDAAGLPGETLELEFTETAAIGRPDLLGRRLGAVRDLGVGLAIDDFGTGHSNFDYLRQVPATVAKLDRGLITGLARAPRDRVIAEFTLGLLHGLGLRSVAEGVETPGVAAMLRGWGCDEGQGYLFAPPIEAATVPAWLRAWPERRSWPAAADQPGAVARRAIRARVLGRPRLSPAAGDTA